MWPGLLGPIGSALRRHPPSTPLWLPVELTLACSFAYVVLLDVSELLFLLVANDDQWPDCAAVRTPNARSTHAWPWSESNSAAVRSASIHKQCLRPWPSYEMANKMSLSDRIHGRCRQNAFEQWGGKQTVTLTLHSLVGLIYW